MINLYQIKFQDAEHDDIALCKVIQSDNIETVKNIAQDFLINEYVLVDYETLEDADEDEVDYKIIWENFDEDVIGFYCHHFQFTITIDKIFVESRND